MRLSNLTILCKIQVPLCTIVIDQILLRSNTVDTIDNENQSVTIGGHKAVMGLLLHDIHGA